MTEREALNMALEALETLMIERGSIYDKAITAVKEALAQPEQEPVAWRYKILDYFGRPVWTFKTPKTDIRVFESQPLYTSPPQPWEKFCDSNCVWTDHHPDCKLAQRKPLSDEEIILIVAECASSHQHTDIHFARAIEAKLKEKNT